MPRTVRAQHQRFALRGPFRISRGVRTAADVVEVSVEEAGVSGRGESVPYARYGESIDSTLAAIEDVRAAVEAGAGREELLDFLEAYEGGANPPAEMLERIRGRREARTGRRPVAAAE